MRARAAAAASGSGSGARAAGLANPPSRQSTPPSSRQNTVSIPVVSRATYKQRVTLHVGVAWRESKLPRVRAYRKAPTDSLMDEPECNLQGMGGLVRGHTSMAAARASRESSEGSDKAREAKSLLAAALAMGRPPDAGDTLSNAPVESPQAIRSASPKRSASPIRSASPSPSHARRGSAAGDAAATDPAFTATSASERALLEPGKPEATREAASEGTHASKEKSPTNNRRRLTSAGREQQQQSAQARRRRRPPERSIEPDGSVLVCMRFDVIEQERLSGFWPFGQTVAAISHFVPREKQFDFLRGVWPEAPSAPPSAADEAAIPVAAAAASPEPPLATATLTKHDALQRPGEEVEQATGTPTTADAMPAATLTGTVATGSESMGMPESRTDALIAHEAIPAAASGAAEHAAEHAAELSPTPPRAPTSRAPPTTTVLATPLRRTPRAVQHAGCEASIRPLDAYRMRTPIPTFGVSQLPSSLPALRLHVPGNLGFRSLAQVRGLLGRCQRLPARLWRCSRAP